MKMQNLKMVITLLLLFVVSSLYSQDSIVYEDFIPKREKLTNVYDNSICLRYSSISGQGIGLSRRFWDFTFIFTGMIQYNETIQWEDMSKAKIKNENTDINYNYGFELQLDIVSTNTTNIFGFLGYYRGKDSNKDSEYGRVENFYSIGGGLGFQWFVHKSFNFELGLGYKYDDKEIEDNKVPSLERKTGVGASFGIKYNF